MDTVTTIIATAVVNAIITWLVGGLIVYRFQKRFDASILKAQFEYQTKYSRLHAKRLETLEAWRQKYMSLHGALKDWIFELDQTINDGSSQDYEEEDRVLGERINELDKFHDANVIFIPLELMSSMSDIVLHAGLIQGALSKLSKSDLRSPLDGIWAQNMEVLLGISVERDLTDPQNFLQGLLEVLRSDSGALYKLYKSVAEIDFDEEYRSYIERITPPKTEKEWRKREKELAKELKKHFQEKWRS